MKYRMRQKFFTFKEDFYIKNSQNQDTYFVDGQLFSLGFKCKLYDMNQQLKYSVKEKLLTMLSNYTITDSHDVVYAVVDQRFTFFKLRIDIKSKLHDIYVEGDFFDWNYKIIVDNQVAAIISKEFFTFTDTYTVDINFEDEAFILCIVCIIDNIIDKQKNHA